MAENTSRSSSAPHYFHTTRATQLWNATLDDDALLTAKTNYHHKTFLIMLEVQLRQGFHVCLPAVLSTDESLESIKGSIRRLSVIEDHISLEVVEEESWVNLAMEEGGRRLVEGNTSAILRLLKERGGVDVLVAKEVVNA